MNCNNAMAGPVNDLDIRKLPRHIAIIMDGNGRWAKQRSLDRLEGHAQGVQAIERVLEGCTDFGIEYLTLFTFSTENWKRPTDEVSGIMALLKDFLAAKQEKLKANGVRLNVVGELYMLDEDVRQALEKARELTRCCDKLLLTVALSYGGRAEIINAARKIAADVCKGIIDPADIDEAGFSSYLYTSDLPDPELLIRTSGELRISNFLLWQLAYSEMHITKTLWPDFDKAELIRILKDYQQRDRRFGNI